MPDVVNSFVVRSRVDPGDEIAGVIGVLCEIAMELAEHLMDHVVDVGKADSFTHELLSERRAVIQVDPGEGRRRRLQFHGLC